MLTVGHALVIVVLQLIPRMKHNFLFLKLTQPEKVVPKVINCRASQVGFFFTKLFVESHSYGHNTVSKKTVVSTGVCVVRFEIDNLNNSKAGATLFLQQGDGLCFVNILDVHVQRKFVTIVSELMGLLRFVVGK